jgi:hypothetical protein
VTPLYPSLVRITSARLERRCACVWFSAYTIGYYGRIIQAKNLAKGGTLFSRPCSLISVRTSALLRTLAAVNDGGAWNSRAGDFEGGEDFLRFTLGSPDLIPGFQVQCLLLSFPCALCALPCVETWRGLSTLTRSHAGRPDVD